MDEFKLEFERTAREWALEGDCSRADAAREWQDIITDPENEWDQNSDETKQILAFLSGIIQTDLLTQIYVWAADQNYDLNRTGNDEQYVALGSSMDDLNSILGPARLVQDHNVRYGVHNRVEFVTFWTVQCDAHETPIVLNSGHQYDRDNVRHAVTLAMKHNEEEH